MTVRPSRLILGSRVLPSVAWLMELTLTRTVLWAAATPRENAEQTPRRAEKRAPVMELSSMGTWDAERPALVRIGAEVTPCRAAAVSRLRPAPPATPCG